MTELLLPPPYAGPWAPHREGVIAANGDPIGYTSGRYMDDTMKRIMAARFFAASPCLGDAGVRLSFASDELAKAEGPGAWDRALADVRVAQLRLRLAVEGLLNPRIAPDKGLNAPISEVLKHLPGGTP